MENFTTFLKCSVDSFKNNFGTILKLYNFFKNIMKISFLDFYDQNEPFSYKDDYYSCKIIENPTKLCILYKNQEPMRSFCFPQSCEDENIQSFSKIIHQTDDSK